MPDRVQDMIRQALAQPPLAHRPREEKTTQRVEAKSGQPREREGGRGVQRDESGRSERAGGSGQESEQRGQASPNPQAQQETAQGGDRGRGGAGAGGKGSGGIYGQEGKPVGSEHANKTFQLKLVLVGQSTRAAMEPQKGQRGTVSDIGVPADGPESETPLNPQQRADEPLVRGEVPPEHEAMIKRIFSHAEE
jgi:hypothetical protein